MFVVDAVGVVGVGVGFGVVGLILQACNAPNIKSSKLGTAECAERSAALPVGESPACQIEMATILKIADHFFA